MLTDFQTYGGILHGVVNYFQELSYCLLLQKKQQKESSKAEEIFKKKVEK